MAFPNFGRKLHSQIVWPLVTAAIIAGIMVTVMAVYSVSSVTDRWVDQVAEYRMLDTVEGLATHVKHMEYSLDLLSTNDELIAAIADGDEERTTEILEALAVTVHCDYLELWSGAGDKLASSQVGATGLRSIDEGASLDRHTIDTEPAFRTAGDGRMIVTASRPIITGGYSYELRLVHVLDSEILKQIAGGTGESTAVYDDRLRPVAYFVDDASLVGLDESRAIEQAFLQRDPAILEAIENVSADPGHETLRTPYGVYSVTAANISMKDAAHAIPGAHLVTVTSLALSEETRNVTVALVALWAAIALVAITALGYWMAGRVSTPLKKLTSGAKRIAEGDFSTRIETEGSIEIEELAASFNDMTDSLRERTESLTKRMLEIALLYEMSKSLGSTLNMSTLLDYVLDSSLQVFRADLGYIALVDRQTGQLELKAWRGGDREPPGTEALRSSLSDWVVREGRPLIFNPTDTRLADRHETLTGALAAMCVPLISSEGTFGAITIGFSSQDSRFSGDDVRLMSTIANHANIAIGNIELVETLEDSYLSTVRSLAAAVDAKDPYTKGHSDRVAQYATKIAQHMTFSRDQQLALEIAAYLHDIGKIGIREHILSKPGILSEGEMAEMRHHPLIGANILKPVGFPWSVAPIVRHHHERWDGTGYPAGLKGDEIPFLARVLSVADAFEAMTADRPYRAARAFEDAIRELQRSAGTHFDPDIVASFVEMIESDGSESGSAAGVDDIGPEEAGATFIVLAEGLVSSFSRLAGPRMASRAETEINAAFALSDLPFRINKGRPSILQNGGASPSHEDYRSALQVIDDIMERMSGPSLLEQYHSEATLAMSHRMTSVAQQMGIIRR